jgi:hypothetical protein
MKSGTNEDVNLLKHFLEGHVYLRLAECPDYTSYGAVFSPTYETSLRTYRPVAIRFRQLSGSLHANSPRVVPYWHVSFPRWHLPQPTGELYVVEHGKGSTSQRRSPPTPTKMPFTLMDHWLTDRHAVTLLATTTCLDFNQTVAAAST